MQILYTILAAALSAAAVYLCVRAFRRGLISGAGAVLRPLLFGAALYLFVQSAVERRFIAGLLLAYDAGSFFPARYAMLFLCVFFCFAACMTERGQRLMRRLGEAGRKRRILWLTSAVVTGLFFIWTLRVNNLSYATNDDISIMRAIARIPSKGLSAAATTWSNIILCAIIGFFYKLAPNGYWYLGYHLAMLIISLTVIGRCILFRATRAGFHILTGCLIHTALCVGLFSYAFGALSFTVTPAAAGAAAIALVLCRSDGESLPNLIVTDVFSALFMFFCRLQRYNTMYAVICFWALAVVYKLAKTLILRADGWKKSAAVMAGGAALTLFLCFFSFTSAASLPSASMQYSNAEYYRSMVLDYMSDDLTEEQWESVGIPPELAVLVRQWFFMDERVNTETFKQLVDMYYEPSVTANISFGGLLSEIGDCLTAPMKPITAAVYFMALFALAQTAGRLRKRWMEAVCALCAAGGATILGVYLILDGRFPLRVFLVTAIPAAVMLILLLLTGNEPKDDSQPAEKRLPVISFLLTAALCLCCLRAVAESPRASYSAARSDIFEMQWRIEDYANENDGLFIYTNIAATNLDPIHRAYDYPNNTLLWGGTGVTASEDRDYADVLFQDNVRFMYQPASTLPALLSYLTLDFGPVEAVMEARLYENIAVVRFAQITPGEDYTGWYEYNGLKYYFEDGQAVTGTHVIDGTEYEFTPSGAQADFSVTLTDGVQVYYTTAYSLISRGD